jgi:hypothetical protein
MFGFVTGASSGVGEAFACRLAADGWDLTITARRGGRLRALAERLTEKHGVSVQTCVADLTDPKDVTELERVIADAEPDLLVNNAGFAGYRGVLRRRPAGLDSPGWRARDGGQPAGQGGGTGHGRGAVRGNHQRGIAAGVQRQPAAAAAAVPGDVRRRQGLPGCLHPGAGGRARRNRGPGPGLLPGPDRHRVPRAGWHGPVRYPVPSPAARRGGRRRPGRPAPRRACRNP